MIYDCSSSCLFLFVFVENYVVDDVKELKRSAMMTPETELVGEDFWNGGDF